MTFGKKFSQLGTVTVLMKLGKLTAFNLLLFLTKRKKKKQAIPILEILMITKSIGRQEKIIVKQVFPTSLSLTLIKMNQENSLNKISIKA